MTFHVFRLSRIWIVLSLMLLFALSSCGETAAPGSTPAAASTPSPVEVQILDFKFDPATVTVPVGTTVVWVNQGPTEHSATSKQGLWDSHLLQKGASYQYTFTKPGTYPYWCTIHPEMLGTIIVQP
jgi:plastocyanin